MTYQVQCSYCPEFVEREFNVSKATCFNCKKKVRKAYTDNYRSKKCKICLSIMRRAFHRRKYCSLECIRQADRLRHQKRKKLSTSQKFNNSILFKQ